MGETLQRCVVDQVRRTGARSLPRIRGQFQSVYAQNGVADHAGGRLLASAVPGCRGVKSPAGLPITPVLGRVCRPNVDMAIPSSPIAALRGRFTETHATRLLWRAGFGPKPGQAKRLAALGLDGAVASLTRPQGPAQLVGR